MTISSYDPNEAPDPKEWLDLDEARRIQLIEVWHTRARIELPSAQAHAIFHAMVENQIAPGDELPVLRKLRSLMAEGLDRHDAIHAIASVLANHVHAISTGSRKGADPNRAWFLELKRLTARSWRRSG